jgi:hypothetical protein
VIILLSTLTTVFMVASLSLDLIVFFWHRQDRQRFTDDEARLTKDEQNALLNELGPVEVKQLRAFLREQIPGH